MALPGRLSVRNRYRRWDGSQDPLAGPIDVRELLDEIGADVLDGRGPEGALRDLLERGFGGSSGLDDIRRRIAEARRAAAEQIDSDSPLTQFRERLDEVIATERAELDTREGSDVVFAQLTLDALPRDLAGRLRELDDYAWASPQAEADFAELVEELRRDLLDSYVRDLGSAMRDVGPEDLQRLTAMLADLNAMLEARSRGEDPGFDDFMAKHGELFPEQPETLDELLDVLARRAAAMSQMLAAMSPDQRRELQQLSQQLFGDLDLQFQLSQLQRNLVDARPDLAWGEPVRGGPPGPGGGQPTPFSAAVDAVERVAELDDLAAAMSDGYDGASLDDVDEDVLRRALGQDAVIDLQRLKQVERALEEAGVLQRNQGQLELTPRGARMLGERALTKLLDRIDREVTTRSQGVDPEPTGQTRPWRFGDREPIAVQRTVHNGVLRNAAAGVRPGIGSLRLAPDDFEVEEQEVRPRTATALLLDLSFSMPLQGHFVHAKRMALALHALIEGKYPQDSLYLIGFSDYARRLQPADLGASGFERVYGTNMQHAFLMARRLLGEDPRHVKQVIMVTDGEPTAHLEGDRSVFNWPPIRETVVATLREAQRLARAGITLNIFLLEDDAGLVAFAERLARLTGGTVNQVPSQDLDRTIIDRFIGLR